MKAIMTLASKELRDMFASPIAYVFISVFLVLSFWIFFSGFFLVGEANLRLFFGWLPVLFIVLLPSVTMGKWSEEKRSGTFELLMTLPVPHWQIVIGKLLSCVTFLFIVLLFTTPLYFVVSSLGAIDTGQVLGAYAGSLLLGISYLTMGLFISSLSRNQIVAFILTVLVLFFLYIISEPMVTSYLPASMVSVFQYLSFSSHFSSMERGVIDSRDVLFFISSIIFFIYLNIVTLTARQGE